MPQPGSEGCPTPLPAERSRSLNFDRIADSYDATRGGEERGRRFAAQLHPFLDPAEPALEIGVGTGVVALGLLELGHRIIGVDLSEAMLRHARRRIGPRVAAGDANRLPIADRSVAQVFVVWVLHVVGDLAAALGEVGRVLRAEGRFLVIPAMGDEPADPIGRIIRDMQARLDSNGRRSDEERRLRSLAADAGLRLAEARDLLAADYEESPAQAIRKVETRSYSILWDVPDESWRALVEPAVTALRALPNPERPIKRRSSGRLLVFVRSRSPRPGFGSGSLS